MTLSEMKAAMAAEGDDDTGLEELPDDVGSARSPPERVPAAPRLAGDILALQELTQAHQPPKRLVRPKAAAVAVYGFGDASGKGFGSTFTVGERLFFSHGQWEDGYDEESSNYRELYNLVLAIEHAQESGFLTDAELFMFTDNTTAELAFYRGTSSTPALFDLALRLRKMQMTGGMHLHVIHIAGTRMVQEGTDGLSRGSLHEGALSGESILSFIPLHLDAAFRSPVLMEWVKEWFWDQPTWLTPEGWFKEGQWADHCIWVPPPAAAETVIEMLGKAKHKRPELSHLVLIPRLMTSHWRKQLSKICDAVFVVPVGTDIWGETQHEPLLVGITLPLIKHRPWRIRGTDFVERVESQLRSLPKSDHRWGRDILREFCDSARRLDSLPEGMVWDMLQRTRDDGVPNSRT